MDLEDESDDENLKGMQGVRLEDHSDEEADSDDDDGGIDLDDVESIGNAEEQEENSNGEIEDIEEDKDVAVLNAGGFDWTANVLDQDEQSYAGSSNGEGDEKPKKKRRKAEIKVDRTGDLDANGPQSVSDFERLLLGQPDSSELWISYMAFQMQLSELSKAREVVERAIKTINIREETEKFNVWSAWLNLEVEYGTDETVDEVFKRACQYNDSQDIHECLISIYIQSNKYDVSINHSFLFENNF
jgi:rRNA biogenesis protein RRP5